MLSGKFLKQSSVQMVAYILIGYFTCMSVCRIYESIPYMGLVTLRLEGSIRSATTGVTNDYKPSGVWRWTDPGPLKEQQVLWASVSVIFLGPHQFFFFLSLPYKIMFLYNFIYVCHCTSFYFISLTNVYCVWHWNFYWLYTNYSHLFHSQSFIMVPSSVLYFLRDVTCSAFSLLSQWDWGLS